MAIRPYRTADNRIDGAVLTLVDIESIRRGLDPARAHNDFITTMLALANEPLAIAEPGGNLRHTNKLFREWLDLDGDEAGRPAPSPLRSLIEAVARDRTDVSREIRFREGEAPVRVAGRLFSTPEARDLVLLRLGRT